MNYRFRSLFAVALFTMIGAPAHAVIFSSGGAGPDPITNGDTYSLAASTYSTNPGGTDTTMTVTTSGSYKKKSPKINPGGSTFSLQSDKKSDNPNTMMICFSFDEDVVFRILYNEDASSEEDMTYSVTNGSTVYYDDYTGNGSNSSGSGSGSVNVDYDDGDAMTTEVDDNYTVTFGAAPDAGDTVLTTANYNLFGYDVLAAGTSICMTYTENGIDPLEEFMIDVLVIQAVPEPSVPALATLALGAALTFRCRAASGS